MKKWIIGFCLLFPANSITLAQNSNPAIGEKKIDLNSEEVKVNPKETDGHVIPRVAWVDLQPVDIPNGYDPAEDKSIAIRTHVLSGADCAPMPNALKEDPQTALDYEYPPAPIIRFVPAEPEEDRP